MTLTPTQLATLRLARTVGIGPIKFHELLARCGNAVEAVDFLKRQNKVTLVADKALNTEQEAVQKIGATQIFWGDDAYPALLKHLPDAPMVLTCLGDSSLLHQKQVGVVGTRTASAIGQKFTRHLAEQLAQAGYGVTSGLARGIDAAAHLGALEAKGRTIAVLGGGVNHIYPPENESLYRRIAAEGCLVSEEAIGGEIAKHNFLRRNRIISGLSLAVVVAEGAARSGSMVTARLALEQGRELFAVPGHPTEPRASGPNALIEAGEARLLKSSGELLAALAAMPEITNFVPRAVMPTKTVVWEEVETPRPEAAPVGGLMALLSTNAITFDELLRLSGWDETTLATELTTLEMEGVVSRLPGGRVALAKI